MPSDWDASSDEEAPAAPPPKVPVVAAKKSKYADEDASDDDNVKDDWDVSDSDEDDKPKKVTPNPAAVGSMRNKGAVKKKIAEKEEAERKRLEEEEQKALDNDPNARRARTRAAEIAADMDSAATLFGASSLNNDPLSMNCSSKEDFTVLAEALSDSLIEKHSSSSHFPYLIEHLARSLLGPVKPEEAKKVRVAIAKVVEEKEKLAKSGNGKGGKPSLGAGKALARGKEDLSSFGEALDDDVAANDFDPDDDFM
ncbi:translation initiation factor eIF3 core subunit j [Sporobolomyces salmoneus]|uniref:translation initiation factor eIF3 core subunit j n=1 Tax=Sporobolomyces salmoneus TaxID=183962 RepID=UPI0031734D51